MLILQNPDYQRFLVDEPRVFAHLRYRKSGNIAYGDWLDVG